MIGLLGRTITKTINVQADLQAETPAVVGDPNQLYQVFMNLAVNACDAMGKSGELLFGTTNESVTPEQASHVPGLSAGDYVVIRVTDTGDGIAQEIQGKIFEPFFTTKDQGQGSGMGLALVYGIVKNHQGYIGVTSTQGVGTTMRIYLPASSAGLPQAESVRDLKPSHGTGHVLVVDDEKEVAEAAQAILEYLGYDANIVLTGEKAVAYCQQSEPQVDMVLLDMVMPDMTGTECFSQLQTVCPETKVVLCTGYDRNHAGPRVVESRSRRFYPKTVRFGRISKNLCGGDKTRSKVFHLFNWEPFLTEERE